MGIRLSVTSFYVFIIAIPFTAFKAFFSALFKSFLIFFNEPLQAEKKNHNITITFLTISATVYNSWQYPPCYFVIRFMKFYYICVREGQGGEWNIPFAYTEIKSRRIAMRRVLFTVSILCSIFLFGCATAEIPSDPAPEASNPETSSDEIFSSFGNDATSDNSWQADESTSSEPPSVNEDIFVSDYTPGEENVYGVSNANLSAGGLRFEAMMTAQGDYIYYIEGTPSAEYPAVLKKVRTDGMEMEILTDNVAGSRMLAVNESGTVIIYYVGIAYNNSSRPSICLSAYNNETGISESLLSFDANNIFIIGMDETSSRLYIAEKYGDSPDRSSQYNLGYYDIRNAQFIICKERKNCRNPQNRFRQFYIA